MSEGKKCLRCGGTNLVPSELQSTGKIYARPRHAKLKAILTTGVPVNAEVCFDCGYVELLVNTDKVKSITKKS